MRSPFQFIISPKGKRYDNSKEINGTTFITNTSIEDAKDVNRTGVVIDTPINYKGVIEKGDEVIIHHNIFREYYDIKGNIKYSKSHFQDDLFLVFADSIYLYKKSKWICNNQSIFIKPIEQYNEIKFIKEKAYLSGEVYYPNGEFKKGEHVSFTPESEYEITVDGVKLYKMRLSDICLKF